MARSPLSFARMEVFFRQPEDRILGFETPDVTSVVAQVHSGNLVARRLVIDAGRMIGQAASTLVNSSIRRSS